MVDERELRRIHILRDLPQTLLAKIAPLVQLRIFSAETVLFREAEELEYFYMILAGQVILEVDVGGEVSVILGTLQPGFSFGISSFIPGSLSSSTAICQEPCELLVVSGERLREMCDHDGHLGYALMLRILRIFKAVMDNRTAMFFKTLDHHPEMSPSVGEVQHLAPII